MYRLMHLPQYAKYVNSDKDEKVRSDVDLKIKCSLRAGSQFSTYIHTCKPYSRGERVRD